MESETTTFVPSCETCTFAHPDKNAGVDAEGKDQYICRRGPPLGYPMPLQNQLTGKPQMAIMTVYTPVPAGYWCGEYIAIFEGSEPGGEHELFNGIRPTAQMSAMKRSV